ncbi:hypothetical protein MTR_7g005475 [Medicago truncatula]|uniref:Uncharacterized protein n=1 Tax=Medicago truncatula TaxID=3880 RepID=A0A072TX68_MEDTR|nr:hypothetical protein MTR_7g005475 [Medicago truncatula]
MDHLQVTHTKGNISKQKGRQLDNLTMQLRLDYATYLLNHACGTNPGHQAPNLFEHKYTPRKSSPQLFEQKFTGHQAPNVLSKGFRASSPQLK